MKLWTLTISGNEGITTKVFTDKAVLDAEAVAWTDEAWLHHGEGTKPATWEAALEWLTDNASGFYDWIGATEHDVDTTPSLIKETDMPTFTATLAQTVRVYELLLQASGFTPARVAERFDMNSRLKGREIEITDQRKGIHRAAVDAILAGEELPESVLQDIREFNQAFPEYPITGETIRQSAQGRMRAQENAEFGVTLNPKISTRLRDELAPAIYN